MIYYINSAKHCFEGVFAFVLCVYINALSASLVWRQHAWWMVWGKPGCRRGSESYKANI